VGSAGNGGVLGEMSMYGNGRRSARLVVEEAGIVYRLTPEGIADLERTDPACAVAFHRALGRILSERLNTANDFIRALST
ncbi:MAG: cyclic nucleotide-binding protein, partial [Acidimicrobiia bacterium]|nr:cyclic nucleotide-binding protein [Acidimicrobiia bacterium]